jgi:hypothetical protein
MTTRLRTFLSFSLEVRNCGALALGSRAIRRRSASTTAANYLSAVPPIVEGASLSENRYTERHGPLSLFGDLSQTV